MIRRREFIQTAAAGAGGVVAGKAWSQSVASTKKALRIAIIGCGGGRGLPVLLPQALKERVVAVVDADSRQTDKALAVIAKHLTPDDAAKVKTFADYRQLFDKMGRELDAVMIATPNHHHYLPAMLAVSQGIHAYIEKPLTLTIGQARRLAAAARRTGVVTQMGQHGHSSEGARRLCEYIWSGAIGQVREVYCWCNKANGLPQGGLPPASPVPAQLDWDTWLGPAPRRDFHLGLHPHSWHRWCDFGNGTIGNMGNHIFDSVFWALKLGAPVSVEAEEIQGGGSDVWAVGTRIRYDFPARGELAPVKVHWYDGLARGFEYKRPGTVGNIDIVAPEARNRPPLVVELEKKYNRTFGQDGDGSLLVGDKGMMTIGPFGDGCRMVPEEAHQAFPAPPKSLPRVRGTHQDDFFQACHGGAPACANLDYSLPLAEMVLLGDMAMRAGAGNCIEWDAANMPRPNTYPTVPDYP